MGKKHFEKDDNFRETYVSNIAMLLHDKYGITDMAVRNRVANDIMAVIFDAKDFSKKDIIIKKFTRFEIMDI